MAGMSDYSAQATLDWETGRAPMPALGNRFLALFTTAPNDSGAGGTEVSGNGYARVQVAGGVTASTSITSGVTTTITVNTGQTWIVPGMNVYDVTAAKQIGTVLTYVSGTGVITLTAAASNSGSGSTDSLQISGWPASSASSGAEPATSPANVTNGAQITFAQATGTGWGTVTSYGLYDAVTSGNFICWDYLGTFKWIPFSATSASPSVLTVDATADAPANGASCVVTQKYGGTLPTTAGSWAGILTSAGLSGATFNLGVNSSTIGGGQFRQVATQAIPGNVTASFSAAQLALSVA
jgi:hypothetical protein